MSYFYFFQNDGSCKWMQDEININYPKYLRDPIEYNGKMIKFYVILDWVIKKDKGVDIRWVNDSKLNYVNSLDDLPENAGIYITGYDADLSDLEKVKKKSIPLIENPCPWIRQLKKQLLNVNPETHQCIFLLDKGHLIYDSYKYIFSKDIIIINEKNYKEEIRENINKKPVHLISYATFRKKDVLNVINFINENYPNPKNIFEGYKKTLCQWTKKGLFEEIQKVINERVINKIWIICSSVGNRSTISIINEVRDHDIEPYIIKKFEDLPENINDDDRIGIIISPIPMKKVVQNFKEFVVKKYRI